MSRYDAVRGQLFTLGVILAGLLAAGFVSAVQAADHVVSASRSTVDCKTLAGGVRAGDTITMAGGNRGGISFRNCVGTPNNRIVIRNDTSAGSRTTIQGKETFVFECTNCEWVTIDGTGKWAGAPSGKCGYPDGRTQCGIKIECSNDGTNTWLRLNGSTKNVTVQGVEVDGGFPNCDSTPPGIGIGVNDHTYKLADHPGEWREGIKIQNNYVHDAASECVYFGPNQGKNGIGDLQLRNNEVAYNLIENCGYDGIELKSTIQGLSEIHHNIVRNTGIGPGDNSNGNNGHGISLFESGFTDVHHNWVQNTSAAGTGGSCFTQFIQNLATVTSVPSNFFNNVAIDCHGNGISAGRKDTGVALPVPTMTHNTVINAGRIGMNTNSNVTGGGTIRDNIACGSAISDVSSSGRVQEENNRTGSCSANGFANLSNLDLRLTEDSPAKDNGSSSEAPADDYNGVSRPQGGAHDQGAFEFVSDGAVVRPEPPTFAAIE
jgi:hypothetical protein